MKKKAKQGQIWEWTDGNCGSRVINDRKEVLQLTGPLVAIEIIDINIPANGGLMYHSARILRDDINFLGESLLNDDGNLILDPDNFKAAINGNMWHLLFDPNSAASFGATCIKCKKDYPYANSSVKFKCWACKNGF